MVENIIKNIKKEKKSDLSYLIRYAWGCNKTWFITKNKKQIMPKNSRLLMKLGCKKTNESISINKKYPVIGNVISDINGEIVKIID